ncbi:MAG TPA: GatB/YqeY domain-containing protein [Chthoniobacterales bacterium]|nr:GatB/YqeY domain-containing protein [Chthoniobacterales bacterium]
MTITEQIDHDLKEAMKARDAFKLGVLRMVKSALKYSAIEQGGAAVVIAEGDALAVLRKQIKQREDSVASFEQGGRPELAEKEKAEIMILAAYLPQGLSEEELKALVQEAIVEAGATSKAQMGAVIKAAQVKAAGRVDGRSLSAEVQKQLG